MKDIRVSKNTDGDYDILISNGQFQVAEDGIEATQHALNRMLIFKGEMSLNGALTGKTEDGTDWYGTIFAASTSKAEKEFELKQRILRTPGINKIVTFNWTQSGNTVTIDDTIVQTDWGDVDISQEITPL